jgi:hypothetical protein
MFSSDLGKEECLTAYAFSGIIANTWESV